jgi:hypothetical protein
MADPLHFEQSLPIRRWPTPKAREWVLELLDAAARDCNIVSIVAIGSSIRAVSKSADIDLVVICQMAGDLKLRPPIEVDVRTFNRDDVDRLIERTSSILGLLHRAELAVRGAA